MDKLLNFDDIYFRGTFRSYQQDVLDNTRQYLSNDKLHIVAAPGSGKTILGLELIRRLAKPALILSPTLTIMTQWGDRLSDMFLSKDIDVSQLVSHNLKDIKLITSVTYQGFFSAYKRIKFKDESSEADEGDENAEIDYSDFDLVRALKASGVKTICLDEAHHLKNEWHKSLTETLPALGLDIKIIALTATPPYDSSQTEWNRYIALCGEIDAEIFVPELVKQKTLCPHQDYIYLNFPTQEERQILLDFRQRALTVTRDIVGGNAFKAITDRIIATHQNNVEQMLDNVDEYTAIMALLSHSGGEVPHSLKKILLAKERFPAFSLRLAETAFGFIIEREDIFGSYSQQIKTQLSKQFIEQKKVTLGTNKKLSKMLVSSKGKLGSIASIIAQESAGLGEGLRMVILADFIKKEQKSQIGKDFLFDSISTVSIMDTAIKNVKNPATKIALLSGGLVVMPDALMPELKKECERLSVGFKSSKLAGTDYSEIIFSSGNKNKVKIITQLLLDGKINILIGTASLLGEGWDSPCINSLILASSVSAFMLSNQMRGRAIRFDKNNPAKTANIWHLASVDGIYPELEILDKTLSLSPDAKQNAIEGLQSKKQQQARENTYEELESSDYGTLCKRFNCFVGPSYYDGGIESGIERTAIPPAPFSDSTVNEINSRMLTLSLDRVAMKKKWESEFTSGKNEISRQEIIPKAAYPKPLTLTIGLKLMVLLVVLTIITTVFLAYVADIKSLSGDNIVVAIVFVIALVFLMTILAKNTAKMLGIMLPKRFVSGVAEALLKSLTQAGHIQSKKPQVVTEKVFDQITCCLKSATLHEKNVFNTALAELLSPIQNPRYIIVKTLRGKPYYPNSYACPTILGDGKKNATILSDNLKPIMGKNMLFYTRTEDGRRLIQKCRHQLLTTRPQITTKTKYI